MSARARLRVSAASPPSLRAADRKARSVPLPHKALLVSRFGARAAHVPVVVGPAVAEALRRRGACAASLDSVVFLPHERVGPDLLAHEVAHALQQMQGGADPLTALLDCPGLVERLAHAPVLPEIARAETEARQAETTEQAMPGLPQMSLPPGVVSLRRTDSVPARDTTSVPAPAPAEAQHEPVTGSPSQLPAAIAPEPQAGKSDGVPSFAPPELAEPTLDPALAAQRDAETAAAREALALADSPAAVMMAYGQMPPSQQALVQPDLGARLGEAAGVANASLAETTPEIQVESRGGDGPLPMPAPVAVPADAADVALAPAPDPTVVVPDAPVQPVLQVDPGYGPQIERRFAESSTPERVGESIEAVSTRNPGVQT